MYALVVYNGRAIFPRFIAFLIMSSRVNPLAIRRFDSDKDNVIKAFIWTDYSVISHYF